MGTGDSKWKLCGRGIYTAGNFYRGGRVKIFILPVPETNRSFMVFDDKERNTSSWLRNMYDYTMGVLWFALGIFLLFHKKLGIDLKLTDKEMVLTNIFGASSVLYGLFRIYRGYKNK